MRVNRSDDIVPEHQLNAPIDPPLQRKGYSPVEATTDGALGQKGETRRPAGLMTLGYVLYCSDYLIVCRRN